MPDTKEIDALRSEVEQLRAQTINLREQVAVLTRCGPLWIRCGLAKLHAEVDLTNPNDPIGAALTRAGFERAPTLSLDDLQTFDSEHAALRRQLETATAERDREADRAKYWSEMTERLGLQVARLRDELQKVGGK